MAPAPWILAGDKEQGRAKGELASLVADLGHGIWLGTWGPSEEGCGVSADAQTPVSIKAPAAAHMSALPQECALEPT